MKPVYLFGDLNVDNMLPIPVFPKPGYEGLAPELYVRPGGSIGNTAVVLVKLGIPSELIAKTGIDLWGRFERESLVDAGVGVSAVVQDKAYNTGLANIVVLPDGERTMFSHRGANRYYEPQDLPADQIAGASILHVSGYSFLDSPQRDSAWQAIEIARSSGVPVSLDTGLQPVVDAPQEVRRALEQSAVCILGRAEAALMYGEEPLEVVANALLEKGAEIVAIKLGSEGSLLASREGQYEFPVFPVPVVDSTGAGDAYSAGLLYGFLCGLHLGAAGMLATALGGLATTVWGAGPGLPSGVEAVDFLRQQRENETDDRRRAWMDEAIQSVTVSLAEERRS